MDIVFSQLGDHAQAHDFSGVVRVQRRGEVIIEFARGQSDRANGRAHDLATRFDCDRWSQATWSMSTTPSPSIIC